MHAGRGRIADRQQALTRVAVILAAKGGPVAAVQVGDCVELLQVAAGMRATSEVHAHSPLFYQLLRSLGGLGEDARGDERETRPRSRPRRRLDGAEEAARVQLPRPSRDIRV